ncbi:glycosyltransferase [Marinobacterium sp. AK62]|uniref:Glycosyltransferase n=1 Tax=Marinobacterium alkalitolerans TaxID=1542925 RepID=A0ABS3Z9X7_9GAMM|nr:glycosyltransferase [Marinobacterium alkalitolerans]MBP0048088.1 glycosyltransferase [Marinobacterium alkalitolerans]
MKIALLSGASSIHTVRWANGLSGAGHEVHVITKQQAVDPFDKGVKVHLFPFRGVLGYFTMVPAVRKLLRVIQPDVVNAHYASGYGTTARLVDYHPWVLSVWGSDMYDFPHKSPVHKWLVKKNLRAADQVASTSHCMADETRTLTPELTNIVITPFGVDLNVYEGLKPEVAEKKPKLVIGTVKSMKPKYGVDTLIQAYALLLKSLKSKPELEAPELELRLVGGGEQTAELQGLAHRLGVAESVNFVGHVPHARVPQELAKLDIYVALSRLDSESFGVAIIEAGAAGRPVVVSDAGGLPEVTVDGKTGFVVPRESPSNAAAALEKLVLDAELRNRMGVAAQAHVAKHYSWDACIETMLGVYQATVAK